MQRDRFALRRKWQTLAKRLSDNKPSDRLHSELTGKIQQSLQTVELRRDSLPEISFPDLPISEKRDAIAEAIANHQVVVIAGETGSGKTTQLPKICLQLGRGVSGYIGHTQPRRLAARSVAQRIAEELNTALGEGVGYQVRFTDQVAEQSHIKLMTDGILLAEIQRDPFLNSYDTLIIDEAHERSLNIDFLLGYLKQLLPKRPDLKLIITSATIDVERFSQHFNDAPVLQVSGRTYPVETRYRPMDELDGDLAAAIEQAVLELGEGGGRQQGDVLVFLSGEGEIREVARHLRKCQQEDRRWQQVEVLPLYARLSNAEQNKVFSSHGRRGRRIVLATNVAETSLTVPGIRYVIDPGYARISRYSYRTKIQRLPIEPISQASANQRQGRCGRVAEGICIRLFSEQDFNNRPEFTDPEIQRTNLASVILQMLTLRMGDIEKFPFVDPPDRRMINDGFKLLEELGAVDKRRQLTKVGKTLARFQVDPRMARMLIAAAQQNCLKEVLIIVSALSIQDPRERPAEKQQAADEKHRRFWDKQSDFLSFVNLWHYYEEQRQELSQSQLRKLCKREFLAFMRMKEWRDIHHQLRLACKPLNYKENREPASFEAIHRALLAGLLSHIGQQDEQRQFLGARNRKLTVFPGSALYKKPPKWLMAAEIAETTQVYARCCAMIEPDWLLGINDPLFKRKYNEPHWQQKTGRVMAYENLSLYGLTIRDRQRIHYGPVDPKLSREILIRTALVEGQVAKNQPTAKAPFWRHNRQMIDDVDTMEAKSRRRDIKVDDQQLFDFYDQRIGDEVITLKHFDKWRKGAERDDQKLLFINSEQLIREGALAVDAAQFPTQLSSSGQRFALDYHFEPGHPADGLTMVVPIGLLNRIPRHRGEWLVPGMLRDKCIALIKLLPKKLRKQLVPVPDYVDQVFAGIKLDQLLADNQPLLEFLSARLQQLTRVSVANADWQPQALDDFYRINYRVVDERGKQLGQGRNLNKLLENFKDQRSDTLQQQTQQRFQTEQIKRWDFGELPEKHNFDQAGVKVTSYPALVDRKDSVAIELMDFPEQAEQQSRRGMVRLLMLEMPQQLKYLRKELLKGNQINLQLAGISQSREQWLEDLLQRVFERVFLEGKALPRNQADYQQRIAAEKGQLVPVATETGQLLAKIAASQNAIRRLLKSANELAWAFAVADIKQQLALLFARDFIIDTPWQQLQQYPRYLGAIEQRLEKLRGHFQRDKQLSQGLQQLCEPFYPHWQNNSDAEARSQALLDFRWMLEEYRVSLFAQQLGTTRPVSEKRLKQQWQRVAESLQDMKC